MTNNENDHQETPDFQANQNPPTQDQVFAASPPFASAGDGFVQLPAQAAPNAPVTPIPGALFGVADPGELSCIQVHTNLGLYLDGELSQAANAAMQNHLATCGACQTAQAFQMQLRSTLATKAFDPMPDAVRDRITKALGF